MRSSSGNQPITPDMVVAAGLRFLGGSPYKDVADVLGISRESAKRVVGKFLDAVNNSEDLAISLPNTPTELQRCADDWSELSSAFGIYKGAVGAIDGWLACIDKPNVSNPADYYSGHYQRYGLNVQAVCDVNLKFIYFGVVAPGKTNDARVFRRCLGLQKWLDKIPNEYFLVGDNAYPLSNKLLIPFSGAQKHAKYNRSYNFYLSQMRIRIEMAFGRLTTKWRIFCRNLDSCLEKNSLIYVVAAKLHNFVIDNDNQHFQASDNPEDYCIDSFLDGGKLYNRGYLPTLPYRERVEVSSDRRHQLLNEIKSRTMEKPIHNLICNQELDKISIYEEGE